jgi:hypothetical protein
MHRLLAGALCALLLCLPATASVQPFFSQFHDAGGGRAPEEVGRDKGTCRQPAKSAGEGGGHAAEATSTAAALGLIPILT